jgi:3-methyladenine DNA glycosylase AlkD
MSKSKNIWYKRMALMSSIALVKNGDIGLAINLCQENLYSEEENIQKAVGICLKEIGIQKPVVARGFILKNIKMPEKIFFIATENMKDIRKLRQTRKKSDFDFGRLMFWKEN